MDLDLDLLNRGTAARDATSELAEKVAGKVIQDGPHKGEPYVYRIVLTGGPCGGKSSSLNHFTKKLVEMGFDVFTVPEVPTVMMNGGCKYPGNTDNFKLMEFESSLMRLQIQAERTFLQVASSTRRPSVIVMDRGINDIAAYMEPALWQELLEREGLSQDYIDSRYDLVLHLVTAADGAEKHYTLGNNAARSETPEQARILDGMVENAYSSAKAAGKHVRVDNSTGFEEKLDRATRAVVTMIEEDTK